MARHGYRRIRAHMKTNGTAPQGHPLSPGSRWEERVRLSEFVENGPQARMVRK